MTFHEIKCIEWGIIHGSLRCVNFLDEGSFLFCDVIEAVLLCTLGVPWNEAQFHVTALSADVTSSRSRNYKERRLRYASYYETYNYCATRDESRMHNIEYFIKHERRIDVEWHIFMSLVEDYCNTLIPSVSHPAQEYEYWLKSIATQMKTSILRTKFLAINVMFIQYQRLFFK